MRALWLALLLALAPAWVAPATVDRSVRIIFVEPAGETFTPGEQARAFQAVADAIDWWHDLSPVTTTLRLSSTFLMTATADVYDNPPLLPADVTIVIIDNSASRRLLYGSEVGEAQDYYGMVWVTLANGALTATLAHELGHVLYHLPDWYLQPGACGGIDIMCGEQEAYSRRLIGCQSLAWLGRPCRTLAFPFVVTP